MFNLKRWIEQNSIKRVGISRFYSNANDNFENTKNAAAYDIAFLKKFLLDECGINADIIKSTDENIDLSVYDLLIFQPYGFIVFGGVWPSQTVDLMYKYANDFNGVTMCVYNDPNVTWCNGIKVLKNKNKVIRNKVIVQDNISEEIINKFQSKKFIGLFVGDDFQKFKKFAKLNSEAFWPNEIINIKLGQYIFYNVLNNIEPIKQEIKNKKFDVVYYGSDRHGSRSKTLKKLFKKNVNLKLKWIGYDPVYPNTSVILKKIKIKNLNQEINDCLTSIVVGDDSHNDNIILYRFYESLKFNVINLIYRSYDSEMKYFQHPELQNLCYVNSLEDIENACNKLSQSSDYYNHILQLQFSEIKRIISSWKD